VCCNYSEAVIITVLKSVARIRLVKAEEISCASDLKNLKISKRVIITSSSELYQ
jgi:hypothetical protein